MIIYPKKGFAFVRKDGESYPCLALTLGSGDSIVNYQEITEEEYNEILARQENAETKLRDLHRFL